MSGSATRTVTVVLEVTEADARDVSILVKDIDIAVGIEIAEDHAGFEGAGGPEGIGLMSSTKAATSVDPDAHDAAAVTVDNVDVTIVIVIDDKERCDLLPREVEVCERCSGRVG